MWKSSVRPQIMVMYAKLNFNGFHQVLTKFHCSPLQGFFRRVRFARETLPYGRATNRDKLVGVLNPCHSCGFRMHTDTERLAFRAFKAGCLSHEPKPPPGVGSSALRRRPSSRRPTGMDPIGDSTGKEGGRKRNEHVRHCKMFTPPPSRLAGVPSESGVGERALEGFRGTDGLVIVVAVVALVVVGIPFFP